MTHENPLGIVAKEKKKPLPYHFVVSHAIPETANVAFSGSLVPEGTGEGIVVRTGDKTVIGASFPFFFSRITLQGDIFRMVTTTEEEETPIRKEISRCARYFFFVFYFFPD